MAKSITLICEGLTDILEVINEEAQVSDITDLINENRDNVWGLIQLLQSEVGMSSDEVLEQIITILEGSEF